MKIKIQHKITFFLILASLQIVSAQKKDENIGTEVVNVVKPYTPTISDAFKNGSHLISSITFFWISKSVFIFAKVLKFITVFYDTKKQLTRF